MCILDLSHRRQRRQQQGSNSIGDVFSDSHESATTQAANSQPSPNDNIHNSLLLAM